MRATISSEELSGLGVTMEVTTVSRALGISVRQVQRLAKSGGLPAFKVGNQWRFSTERIAALISGGEVSRG